MELSGLWRLQQFEVGQVRPLDVAAAWLDDRFWITAKVPGDVHSALIERELIENPYFGHNDAKSRWIEQKEWWYRHSFNYSLVHGTDEKEKHELTFEGLDTFATIYVNGKEIGTTSNMLMAHTFDVTRVIQDGKNSIAVKFDPLHLHNKDKELFQWSSYTKERPWLRKAAMNFGWDWGPRMVTVGIWGKVFIERYRRAKLDSVFARTRTIHDTGAEVQVDVDVTTLRKGVQKSCDIRLVDAAGQVVASAQGNVQSTESFTLQVVDPQLWWTHDLGKPYLYELEVVLYADGEQVDAYRKPLGIRTIELQLKDAEGQNAFAFVLNGVKLFAKGTNWIPADHFIGSIPDQRYRDLIDLSVTSNQNMLRVWAGGIYEKDVFYEECDKRGVLVWQDFAFANALFPDFNRDFMENVRNEVIYNIKRLRNYTSLALWCGNNEIDWLYDMKSAGGDINCPFYGEIIYHELIPDALELLDDSRAYWPSSPFGGNDANDPDVGDRHNWQVWHGSVYPRQFGDVPLLDYSIQGVTFKNYKKDFTLFSSEFGMHASANRYTLEKNIPNGQFYWNSVEMAYRNKDTNHQKGILLMEGYTGIPTNIEEYMNFSMLTQAEGLKYGIEHYRRNKHRTSGSLIWQLNDSWPGTSWSLIDYELLPKASFYYATKFYHPLLLSIDHEPGQDLHVWAVNDTLAELQGQVHVTVYNFSGEEVFKHTFEASVAANSAIQLGSLPEATVLNGASAEQVVVRVHTTDWAAPDNLHYLRDQKDLQFPATSLSVNVDAEAQTVQITANGAHARMVKLDLPQGNIRFSDNFFDLLAGEQVTVQISDPTGAKVDLNRLTVSAMNV
ncbi:glycoside hydrolase family 2 protein [Paenibacillus sp. LMG 31461]|uniref:Beta-mannosidase B n=1 Tax=Paenibacillus plantarum TaxID=2654975 RepID=A0ABX1XHG8_9BACL|nr:glycoside hydrolase family 2 protein [Paenibacillus plantarum]NOU67877.1 glycoside hydrolase family 2 protein [Paenibacillus plantarum]